MSFFQELNKLRGSVKTIATAITFVGTDQISVIVTPKVDEKIVEKSPQLATPFVLTATAEELDAAFADQFTGFEVIRTDVATQAKQQADKLKAAKPKAIAVQPSTKSGSSELSSLLAKGDPLDEGSDTNDVGTQPVVTPPSAQPVAKVAEALTAADLFGEGQ